MSEQDPERPGQSLPEINPPQVFISYSHDSPEHKRWVAQFAEKLMNKGIDVILDQWDLRLGDDVPKFMERSVRESDRVLVVCTNMYMQKFNDGIGGVGYESVVVTGELIRDIGTAKFIPVVREKVGAAFLPSALSTRLYIDLTEGSNSEEQVESLVREVHNAPAIQKPPIGANPFAKTPGGNEAVVASPVPQPAVPNNQLTDTVGFYRRARSLALVDDPRSWRDLVTTAKGFSISLP